jgi:hypothetical protein
MDKSRILWASFKHRRRVAQALGRHRLRGCRDSSSKYTAIINKLSTEYLS